MKTKLIRNLKPGDKLQIRSESRSAVVTVRRVQEIPQGIATGRRRWEVSADYPFWWGLTGVIGYSSDRIEVL